MGKGQLREEPGAGSPNHFFSVCISQKSNEDVSNFDPEFLKEEPILTPIEDGILAMINQEEFRNFSYTDPELES
uniref:AGC-kinase C-terminal domain-containing protein n=1 Tax=Varanus komodoensis TaxID=61221 RepID=A0A8D2IKR1_VARKO